MNHKHRKSKNPALSFLVIGAQKAGTSWLYKNLRVHPEVFLPPEKEIHFFDLAEKGQFSVIKNLFGDNPKNVVWRRKFRNRILYNIPRRRVRWIKWWSRFLFLPKEISRNSLKKYSRLFENQEGKISGDITPAYSTLKPATIHAIRESFPHLKIIFILRNPVDRTWSNAKMNLVKRKEIQLEEVDNQVMIDFLTSDNARSNYNKTIRNWTDVFPLDQMHFGFFDELEKDPIHFYGKILEFLGLSLNIDSRLSSMRFNPGISKGVPVEYEKLLYQKYLQKIEKLAVYFEDYPVNYPHIWFEKGKKILDK